MDARIKPRLYGPGTQAIKNINIMKTEESCHCNGNCGCDEADFVQAVAKTHSMTEVEEFAVRVVRILKEFDMPLLEFVRLCEQVKTIIDVYEKCK